MALPHLSVGDILMLSQSAWRTGQAFRHGNKSAPKAFAEVEREANALSDVLKLIAETLHDDSSVLSCADDVTTSAIHGILASAGKTLAHLDFLVESYQVVKKTVTSAGVYTVERSWSPVVASHSESIKWTTGGGSINDLLERLQMHTNAIRLMMHALQSRSLARLENAVRPRADNTQRIHENLTGKQNGNPHVVQHSKPIADETPNLPARICTVDPRANDSTAFVLQPPPKSPLRLFPKLSLTSAGSNLKLAASSFITSVAPGPRADNGRDAGTWNQSSDQTDSENFGCHNDDQTPNDVRPDSGVCQTEPKPSPKDSVISRTGHCSRRSDLARPESQTLPKPNYRPRELLGVGDQDLSITSEAARVARTMASPEEQPSHAAQKAFQPITPSTSFESQRYCKQNTASTPQLSPLRDEKKQDFLRQLCRNAAILCDVGCRKVEFVQEYDPADPRYNVDKLPACQESRLCVIRRRETCKSEGTSMIKSRMITSIWCISQDGQTRLQQELSESQETVPHCSYFEREKVTIRPSEFPIHLKYHAEMWGAPLTAVKTANWVDYHFSNESDAMAFQSAVFGRTLIGSYWTNKTTVIHPGLKGAFAFEEQFACYEVLRLWEEDGVLAPGAAGGVFAMMHTSSNFGDGGWAKWWINNSRQPVKLKADGARHVKMKGVHVSVPNPGKVVRKVRTLPDGQYILELASPTSSVSGVRIEFKTEDERASFLSTAERAQERSLNLPDLTWALG